MSWIILCPIKFPFIQEKICEEIDKVFGDHPPIISDRSWMPYAEAVFLETLRFKTQIPLSLPVIDAVLSGYDIPKDIIILIKLHSLARGPTFWNYPNAFHPEHFLTSDGTPAGVEPGQIVPPPPRE